MCLKTALASAFHSLVEATISGKLVTNVNQTMAIDWS